MDWDVVEGRREGEVRAGLAEKIRKLRKRNGEAPQAEPDGETKEEIYQEVRRRTGIMDWDGVQGDLVLGRHTWKEYIRGLHEGWLGPLGDTQTPESETPDLQPLAAHSPDSPLPDLPPSETSSSETSSSETSSSETLSLEKPASSPPPADTSTPESPSEKPVEKPKKPLVIPPYIMPSDYASSPAAPTLPSSLPPSLSVPLPHLLGFFNFPIRIYRFLTRRHLADSTGASVAALVLASHSHPYIQSTEFASAIDPDDASPSIDSQTDSAVTQTKEAWEQEAILRGEELEWHKSAWKPNEEEEVRERVWQEKMVVDGRIGSRMRRFELGDNGEEEATKRYTEARQKDEGYMETAKKWIGIGPKERPGWEMGLEGDESA